MKRTSLALFVALSAAPLTAFAGGVQQFHVNTSADPTIDCSLQNSDNNEPLTEGQRSQRTQSGCRVSVPLDTFNQRFQFCSLSAIKETNDERLRMEHDYGSQCSFEIIDNQAVFTAVRGYGFHPESTSMLSCGFTCVENPNGMPGDDLDVIKSEPLPEEKSGLFW